MADPSLLAYPKKSHRKQVTTPETSEKLAEFFGLMLGDGGIGNPWQLTITMNSEKDKEYSKYVVDLIHSLFGVRPAMRTRKDMNALVIVLSSTTIVDFVTMRGLPRGNKLAGLLEIPGWIMEKPLLKRACVRGLMDTDGCLFVHRHKTLGRRYENIGLCFTSLSKELTQQVADIFLENRIVPHITADGTRIYLYSVKAVEQYLQTFGSSNPRISKLYQSWRANKARDLRFKTAVV